MRDVSPDAGARVGPVSVAILLAAACAASLAFTYVNHDAAWYLHMAGVWLDGGRLYQDVIDTNPPLIVFLTAIPVAIARGLGESPPVVFKALVFIAACLSLTVSVRQIFRIAHDSVSRLVLVAASAFAILPFAGPEFGQREHVAVLLTVPYAFAAVAWANRRPTERWDDVLTGVAGGLGFAIKPHFALAWISLEAILLVLRPQAHSWRRPALIAAVLAVAAYGAIVLAFIPAYFTVAREVLQVYGGLNSPAAIVLRRPELKAWAVGAAALVLLRIPKEDRVAPLALFGTATGFLLAGMVQMKGWGYHLYPSRAFGIVCFGAIASAVVEAHPSLGEVVRGGRRAIAATLVAATLLWSGRAVLDARAQARASYVGPLAGLVGHHHADSLAVLSMRNIVYPAFPVVNYTGVRWPLRHNSLWFMPGLYAREIAAPSGAAYFHSPQTMTVLERKYFAEVVDDLCADPPQLLVIEPPIPGAPAGLRSIDLAGYYRQDARFDRMFTSYTRAETVGPFVAYVRQPSASCAPASPVEGRLY